jgi:hypothetical protein
MEILPIEGEICNVENRTTNSMRGKIKYSHIALEEKIYIDNLFMRYHDMLLSYPLW